jgi:hypothetical protein
MEPQKKNVSIRKIDQYIIMTGEELGRGAFGKVFKGYLFNQSEGKAFFF